MMHKLRGCGLNNVYLKNGFKTENDGEFNAVAYFDLAGLYKQLVRSVAVRTGTLSAEELRFLRKRLKLSQAEVGLLGDKTEQAVAKWEKGTLPVPKAEANLLRLKALATYRFKSDIPKVIDQLNADGSQVDGPYVFSYLGGKWTEDNSALVADVAVAAEGVLYTIRQSARNSAYTQGAARISIEKAKFQDSGVSTV